MNFEQIFEMAEMAAKVGLIMFEKVKQKRNEQLTYTEESFLKRIIISEVSKLNYHELKKILEPDHKIEYPEDNTQTNI